MYVIKVEVVYYMLNFFIHQEIWHKASDKALQDWNLAFLVVSDLRS